MVTPPIEGTLHKIICGLFFWRGHSHQINISIFHTKYKYLSWMWVVDRKICCRQKNLSLTVWHHSTSFMIQYSDPCKDFFILISPKGSKFCKCGPRGEQILSFKSSPPSMRTNCLNLVPYEKGDNYLIVRVISLGSVLILHKNVILHLNS